MVRFCATLRIKELFYGDNTRKGILYFEFSNVLTFNELAKYGIFIQDAFK